ncbi:MAG: rhodanese-like domain-containing protein [Gammaproteobacteria bacterium]
MQILNISGYKFITLSELPELQTALLNQAKTSVLKGTILLSVEGINLNLAGMPENLAVFLTALRADLRFTDMTFRESYSAEQPFKHMKVKLKDEIITLREPNINPAVKTAPAISPREFKQWLDEKRDIVVLDTRNDYEVRFGTFTDAQHLQLDDFSDFPAAVTKVVSDKPVVMCCTGGIRCEKAAAVMLNAGYSAVYQLQGGILNYFAEVGGDHYQGECFVFDQRVAVDPSLQATGTVQCRICQGPVTKSQQITPYYIPNVSCHACVNHLT